jgi:hypothetical protein
LAYGCQLAGFGFELFATACSKYSTAALDDPANVSRMEFGEFAGDETPIAVPNAEHLKSSGDSGARHRPYRCVHPGRITAAREKCNTFHRGCRKARPIALTDVGQGQAS